MDRLKSGAQDDDKAPGSSKIYVSLLAIESLCRSRTTQVKDTIEDDGRPQPSVRKKPAKDMHDRWVKRAGEMRKKDSNLGQSEIARRIRREDSGKSDPHTKGMSREEETIRRVLTKRQSEWIKTENN